MMTGIGRFIFALVVLSVMIGARAEAPADDVSALVPRLKDYSVKHRVIHMGLPAIEPLFKQLATTKDAELAVETRSALRWIAANAVASPAKRRTVVEMVTRYVKPEQSPAVRELAVELLGTVGGEESLAQLATLLEDGAVREAACASLAQIPGSKATQVLCDAYGAAPPEFRPCIVHAMGVRRDSAAVPVLLKAATDQNEQIRLAALRALGMAAGAEALPTIEAAIKKGPAEQRTAAFASLIQIGDTLVKKSKLKEAAQVYGKGLDLCVDDRERVQALAGLGHAGVVEVVPRLTEAIEKGSPAVKTAALTAYVNVADAVWEKGKQEEAARMYARVLEMATGEAAQVRALIGCGRARCLGAIPKMKELLQKGSTRVQTAAAQAIHLIPGEEASQALAGALKSAAPSVQCVLLSALAERHDPETVPAIIPLAASENEDVAVLAVKALGAIADPAGESALLTAMQKGPDGVRVGATAAFLQLADALATKGMSKEASAMYCRLLDISSDGLIRAAAFGGLAQVATPDIAAKIEPLLEKEEGSAREQAIDAYIACAGKCVSSGKTDEGKRIYRKALTLVPMGSPRHALIRRALADLGEKMHYAVQDGVIKNWWVIGSFPARDDKAWQKKEFPEKGVDLAKEYARGTRTIKWLPVQTAEPHGVVQLAPLFTLNEKCVCYAYVTVIAPAEQDVHLKIGSNDGFICWVNGQRVGENLVHRSLKVDSDDVEAHLKQGSNGILLKICQSTGEWSFCVRITDAKGEPLKFETE